MMDIIIQREGEALSRNTKIIIGIVAAVVIVIVVIVVAPAIFQAWIDSMPRSMPV